MTDHPIRRAVAADANACAQIVSAWIENTEWMPEGPSVAELVAALATGLPMREAYVIGDPVAGYLSMEAETNHIHGFYVASPGQGVGVALLNHVKSGRTYLRLNTHLANARAHEFYTREGFERTDEPWVGNDDIEEIRMEWHT